ncbi:dual specificity protein phosphatase 2 [Fukomys damarensis]|uniref:dual specificity protein phosphatase 2 n=1 Tax=Fukomys damarensis TaxID=885580 RepID=UPI000540044A|nr:dual specificity protein phosphatase 2 [Fukomys damarensis]
MVPREADSPVLKPRRHRGRPEGTSGSGRAEPVIRARGRSGGSGSAVAMGLETACELESAALGALLREPREAERTLLLDCRPASAPCATHAPPNPGPVEPTPLTAPSPPAGGFDGFQDCCPDLCSEGPAPVLPPFGAENSSSDLRVPIYDQGGPVEILPFLYLGSCSHSSDLQGLRACGITAVLNVSSSCPNHFEGLLRYKSIPVEDNQMAEISVWFQEAIGFIDSVKNSGGRVLVHCQAGISRSATICLAYLIQSRRVRLDEAFDFVKQRRGVISPNFSFMGQLLQFETQVLCH